MYYDGSRDIKDLILVVKDSDIVLCYSNFKKIDVQSEGKVRIHDCSSDSSININAKTVEIKSSTKLSTDYINLNAEYVEFNRVCMKSDLNINSKLISINNSEVLYSKNIKFKADMIECKDTKLKAQNKIEITNTNCDEISGVEAPIIIYNEQDITHSEGIVMPKLRKQLLDHLREIRNNVARNIDDKIKDSTQKQKENLESKPIIKVLKNNPLSIFFTNFLNCL